MEHKKAVKIAVQAMKKEMRTIAFDANTHEKFGNDHPSAVNAFKRRAELREAIEALTGQPKMNYNFFE